MNTPRHLRGALARIRSGFLCALLGTSGLSALVAAEPTPGTALVRHAPQINGTASGSIQQMLPENVTLNGGATITGDLLVPGTPSVRLNGKPSLGGTVNSTGLATPTNYQITLNGNAALHSLVRRVNPLALPAVAAPASPSGTRTVTLNSAGQSVGSWSTLSNLTLNGAVGQIAVPAGTYGDFTANSGGFILGVPGAITPAIYNFQRLTLNGQSKLTVVGPVIVNLANGFNSNGTLGSSTNPSWLALNFSAGGLTLNGSSAVFGYVSAPNGSIIVNGSSQLVGGIVCDRLTVNGGGQVRLLRPTALNQAPIANPQGVVTDEDQSKSIVLGGNDPEGAALTFRILSAPRLGTLSQATPGSSQVLYTPAPNENQPDSFTFVVNDGLLDSAPATVSITINPIDDRPIADPKTADTDEDHGVEIVPSGFDVESGSSLQYALVTQPAHGQVVATAGTFTYTPSLNFHGGDSFTYLASDGVLSSEPVQVVLVVRSINDVPVASPQVLAVSEGETLAITLTGIDADSEDSLTYSVTAQPTRGTLSGTTPNLSYRPSANSNEVQYLTFVVNDGHVDSPPASVRIVVTNRNDPPVADSRTVETPEDVAKSFAVTGSDPDGDAISFVVVGNPAHGTLSGTAPNLTYTPASNYSGEDSFVFVTKDQELTSAPATVDIVVAPANDVPTATAQTLATDEDVSLAITLTGNDGDGDSLTFAVLTPPAHGTLDPATGARDLVYHPEANFHGEDSFAFVARDPLLADSAPATVSITINPINDRPTADPKAVETDEDHGVEIVPSGSDLESGASLQFALLAQPAHGQVVATAGTFTYTPSLNFHGSDSFTYLASDGALSSEPAQVSVVVRSINDVPVAIPQELAVAEGETLAIILTATDADTEDAMTFSVIAQPASGVLGGIAPNLTYQPPANSNDLQYITFVVNDGHVASPPATVRIVVTNRNDQPVADPRTVETTEDGAKSFTLTGSDPDGDPITFAVVGSPAHGVLSGTAPNLTYTPDSNYSGEDSFVFVTKDHELTSAPATVAVIVTPTNDAPTATSQILGTDEDVSLAITLTGTDGDGDALTFAVLTPPAHGTLDPATGARDLVYHPEANFHGEDSFVFVARDSLLAESEPASVSITINPINDPPVALELRFVTDRNVPVALTLAGMDVDDPSGAGLTYSILSGPAHGTLADNTGPLPPAPIAVLSGPILTYTPSVDYAGDDSIVFVVSDSESTSAPATASVQINATLLAPVFAFISPVSFDDPVNTTTLRLAGTIAAASAVQLTLNGVAVPVGTDGGFDVLQPLPNEGANTLTLSAEDTFHHVTTKTFTIYRLTQAPTLTLTSPATDRSSTRLASIQVAGTIGTTATQLFVNSAPVADFSNGTFSHPLTLVPGENAIVVEVRDALGNSRSLSRTVVLDQTPPTLADLLPLPGFLTNVLIATVTGRVVDGHTLTINGTSVALAADGAFSHPVTLVEGSVSITLEAKDAVGNSTVRTVAGQLDTLAPLISIGSPVSGTTVAAATATVSGTVDDPAATLTINSVSVPNNAGAFSAVVPLTGAETTITVQARDAAGNATSKAITVRRDATPPAIAFTAPANGSSTRAATVRVAGIVDDPSASVTVNGRAAAVADGRFEIADFALAEGQTVLSAIATDTLGNSSAPVSITVTADRTAPAIPVLIAPPAYSKTDRVTLTGTTEPAASVSILGGLAAVSATADAAGGFSATVLVSPNRSTDLFVRARDAAGNESDPLVYSLVSDTVAPVITLVRPAAGASFTTSVIEVLGTVADSNPGATITVHGQTVALSASGQFGCSLTLPDGAAQPIVVTAIDLAGNQAQQTRTVNVANAPGDDTPPTIEILTPAYDAVVPAALISVSALVTDESPLASVTLGGASVTDPDSDGVYTAEVSVDANGEFVVSATDSHDLTTTITHRVRVDGAAPTAPTIQRISPDSPTSESQVVVYGSAQAGLRYEIVGGLVAKQTGTVGADGKFIATVPLTRNAANSLQFTMIGANGVASAPATASVVQDSIAPTITGTAPAALAVNVDPKADIQIVFSEAVRSSDLAAIQVLAGATPVVCTRALSTDAKTLTLSHGVEFSQATAVQVTVPVTVRDLAGNPLGSAFVFGFTTIDSTAPATPVLGAFPARTNKVALTLTGTAEPLSRIVVAGAAAQPATADAQGRFSVAITLNPNSTNSLQVAASDASGNTSAPRTLAITHDDQPVALVSSIPAEAAKDVPVNTLVVLTFNKAVDPASLTGVTLMGSVAVPAALSVDGAVVTLTPAAALQLARNYEVVIPATVADPLGNRMADSRRITFSTLGANAIPAPIVYSAQPAGATNLPKATISGYSNPGTLVLVEGGAAAFEFGPIDTTGLFTFDVPLQLNAPNTIVLRARDAQGQLSAPVNALVVRHDSVAPTVVRTIPAAGAAAVNPHAALFIEFSEAIQPEPLAAAIPAIRLLDAQNFAVGGSWLLSADGRGATFYPRTDLTPKVHFTILVGTTVRDLAGNPLGAPLSVEFTTGAAAGSDRPATPVLDPLASNRTTAAALTLAGTAPAGATLRVFGGQGGATATVGTDGRFSVSVTLVPNSSNPLAVVAEVEGVSSDPATITIVQVKHSSGIRILAPLPGREYVYGAVTKADATVAGVTVAGVIDDPEAVASVTVAGVKAALVGRYFFRPVNLEATAGTKTLTAIATNKDGSTQEASVEFTLVYQAAGADTKPPVPHFIFPEEGDVLNGEVAECLVTVEEGVQLTSVDIDRVVAHEVVGNVLFIAAALSQQGPNTITVRATDASDNVGTASVNVVLDSVGFATPPVVDPISTLTNDRVITLTGTAEPGSTIVVMNGLVPVRAVVDAAGKYSVQVPLNPNTSNHLQVVATDAAGNLSPVVSVDIAHDDAPPTIVSTSPFGEATGVPQNAAIEVVFSEPLSLASVTAPEAVVLRSALNQSIQRNVLLSADGKTLRIVPTYKFLRGDTITVELAATIADLHSFTLGSTYAFSFATVSSQTTVSGIVVDPQLRPLANVLVGIQGSGISQLTSSFGTFILDNAPVGDQILTVDARPDVAAGILPRADGRVFNYLEFFLPVRRDVDNGLGRPIFMVDTDASTATQVAQTGAANVLTFTPATKDLAGFSITYAGGSVRFADGTTRGKLTATRIDPANIPDRLPSGAIPHFLVELGPDGLGFDTPARLTFPNVYNLAAGAEVIVFHFKYGVHNYVELGRAAVGADGRIVTTPLLTQGGFLGIIPADKSFDLTRNILEGRVVAPVKASDGSITYKGLAGISVNAIAGDTYVVTDAAGKYSIPLPDVRLTYIRTFATVSTDLGALGGESPSLVFQSALATLAASGVTKVPDIVVDSFFLGGSIRYVDADGARISTLGTGDAYTDDGRLVNVDPTTAKAVEILVYRRISAAGALPEYDSEPYLRTTADRALIDSTYASSFTLSFLGSLASTSASTSTSTPVPGDVVKLVAFDRKTGCYGETDLTIPSASAATTGSPLDVLINLELRPPLVGLDINRVFFLDGIRRRANVPHRGIAFTGDEYVEFKTTWTTPAAKPLDRPELALAGRLRVNSIDYQTDYGFTVRGGEHFRVLELREALVANRLSILQRDTDVGIETVSVSRDGSFADKSLLPIAVRTDAYGLASASSTVAETSSKNVELYILNLALAQDATGLNVAGRFLPGRTIRIGGHSLTTDGKGYINSHLDGTFGSGIEVGAGDSLDSRYGETLTPIINALIDTPPGLVPSRGGQGIPVVINGVNFSPVADDNKVDFNGAAALVQSASETQLAVVVPELASSGDVTVTIAGKKSNGVRFDFLSVGINNGSFEDGTLRAFTLTGSGRVVESWKRVTPSHLNNMAFLDTMGDPRDGVSTLTSDAFEVPAGMQTLLFDYNFVATALLKPVSEVLEFHIVPESGPAILVNDLFASVALTTHAPISGFEEGSGFRTAGVLVTPWAGTGQRIRLRLVLKGRGALPEFIPGANRYDHNPIGLGKNQGTGLFLDNFRLSTGFETALPALDHSSISIASDGDNATITLAPGTLPTDSRIYLCESSGVIHIGDIGESGTFTCVIPFFEDDQQMGFFISYATGNPSVGRFYSPQIELGIAR